MFKKQKEYRKNLFWLSIHLIFAKRITGPVMMLLYQSFGLNYSQIGTLDAVATLSDASIEVYGGAFSDVYGRRKCSILYAFLAMANMAIFAFGHSFLAFAVGSAVYGASLAIGMGNTSALLFDTLKFLRLENRYKKYRGQMQLAAKIVNGLIILSLPFLYLKNIKLPFFIGLFLYGIAFVTALFLKEPPKARSATKSGIIQTTKQSFIEIVKNKKILFIIAFQAVWAGFILLFFEYFQPIIKSAGIPLAYFGLIYAAARIFEGIGSGFIHRFERHANRKLFYANIFMLVLALLGFALSHSYLLVVFIMIGCMADGVADVLQTEKLNYHISTKNRTTIMSIGNVANGLFTSLIFFTFGHLSDQVGVQRMFLWAGISFLALLGIMFFFLNYQGRTQIEKNRTPD